MLSRKSVFSIAAHSYILKYFFKVWILTWAISHEEYSLDTVNAHLFLKIIKCYYLKSCISWKLVISVTSCKFIGMITLETGQFCLVTSIIGCDSPKWREWQRMETKLWVLISFCELVEDTVYLPASFQSIVLTNSLTSFCIGVCLGFFLACRGSIWPWQYHFCPVTGLLGSCLDSPTRCWNMNFDGSCVLYFSAGNCCHGNTTV